MSKPSAIDEILSRAGDNDVPDYDGPGVRGRKPNSSKPAVRPSRNTQAWRTIENALDSRRLDRKLKEVYDD